MPITKVIFHFNDAADPVRTIATADSFPLNVRVEDDNFVVWQENTPIAAAPRANVKYWESDLVAP